jgi:Domain of unknown function (DUF4410)
MLRFPILPAAALIALALAGCAEHADNPTGAHANLIIVREFAAPLGVVTLDPTFGFSLHRGSQGVPPIQRAGGVARAAAFTLADTIVQQLRAQGYDAVRSNDAGPEPGGRALIVTGALSSIDEGYRRRAGAEASSVAADAEVDYQTASGQPQRLEIFRLDSRQIGADGVVSASARREPVNAAAARVGAAIARSVSEFARSRNWPGAPR